MKPLLARLSRWFATPGHETPRTGHDALRAIMADPSMGAEARALSLEALVAMPPVSAPPAPPERRQYDVPVPDVSAPYIEPAPDPEKQRRQERTEDLQRLHAANVRASVAVRESVQTAAVTLAHSPAATPRLRRQQIAKMRLWRKPRPVSNVVNLDAERERRTPREEAPSETPATDTPPEVSVPKSDKSETQATPPVAEATPATAAQASTEGATQAIPAPRARATRRKRKPKARAKRQGQSQAMAEARAAQEARARAAAVEWLRTVLAAEGEQMSGPLKKRAKGAGHATKTLGRAASELHIVWRRVKGGTTWRLP